MAGGGGTTDFSRLPAMWVVEPPFLRLLAMCGGSGGSNYIVVLL
jgi:hypothetical protein